MYCTLIRTHKHMFKNVFKMSNLFLPGGDPREVDQGCPVDPGGPGRCHGAGRRVLPRKDTILQMMKTYPERFISC